LDLKFEVRTWNETVLNLLQLSHSSSGYLLGRTPDHVQLSVNLEFSRSHVLIPRNIREDILDG